MFERQSMEQLLAKMVRWTRGTSTKLTDFRVGSKVRTLYEAVAIIVEELYDKVFRSMRSTIEDNIYSVLGFNKLSATYATGTVLMGREEEAEQDYAIPMGTALLSTATEYRAPVEYRTTEDAVLHIGMTSVEIPVIAAVLGELGNAGANMVTEFMTQPSGIEYVTNAKAILGGEEEETKDQQKLRFQQYVESTARGDIQAIQYGATLATVENSEGTTVEYVRQAKAFEYLPERRGEVDLYIWNGIGQASEALKSEVGRILRGFFDDEGNPVYGYKPAGTFVNVYSSVEKLVRVRLVVTPEEWTTTEELKPQIELAIATHFANLSIGGTLFRSRLEASINGLDGVMDVIMNLSEDGETYSFQNVIPEEHEILAAHLPIEYAEMG